MAYDSDTILAAKFAFNQKERMSEVVEWAKAEGLLEESESGYLVSTEKLYDLIDAEHGVQ